MEAHVKYDESLRKTEAQFQPHLGYYNPPKLLSISKGWGWKVRVSMLAALRNCTLKGCGSTDVSFKNVVKVLHFSMVQMMVFSGVV